MLASVAIESSRVRRRRQIAALAGACLLAVCGRGAPPAPAPPEVAVAPAVQRDVPVTREWIGTTEGMIDAEIRAQVSGYLISRDYAEGSLVRVGDLLFRIDPRPARAALDQARGDLGRALAQLEQARLDVERYTPLVKTGSVSRQEYDNAVQQLRANQAAVRAARAALEKSRIELSFTEVRSLIDGLAGVAVRQIGELVGPSDTTPLTTVSQLDPIRVAFPVSERDYLQYADRFLQAVRQGGFRKGAEQLILTDGSVYPHRGTGYAANREVDPHTGTILVKGLFPNPELLLRPGQYARVRVEVDTLRGALLVPQRAVQELQGLHQVAVVGEGQRVEIRVVEAGPIDGSDRVIERGLQPGERVVVEGLQKIRDGAVVTPKPWRGPPPPDAGVGAGPAEPAAPGGPQSDRRDAP